MGEFPWVRRGGQPGPQKDARQRIPVGISAELSLGAEHLAAIAALFPAASFEVVEQERALAADSFAVVVLRSGVPEAARLGERLKARAGGACKAVVVLDQPNLMVGLALLAAGAADVLYQPLTDAQLGLSLERLLAAEQEPRKQGPSDGRLVALLKAGGGAGATSLGVQTAALLSARGGRVCFADLDLQYGAAGLYLDLPDALTVTECLQAGEALTETPFISRLATHSSGLRLLGAPADITPLELLDERSAEFLIRSLRREMDLTLLDLPSDWTAWSHRLMHSADRIVLVCRLTVGSIQLAKRQLRMLVSQQLHTVPLTLVCNAAGGQQQQSLPVKAAERALGRAFDIVVPDEPRVMGEAINEGVTASAVRGGGRLMKALNVMADALAPAPVQTAGWR